MGMNRLSSSSSSNVSSAHRAWRLLRLALLRARNGGLLKCRLANELRLIPKHLKAPKHHHHHHQRHHRLCRGANVVHYGERQLSFDETPVFHHMRKTNLQQLLPSSLRNHIPCLKPEVVDFDFIDEDDDDVGCWYDGRTTGFLDNDDAGRYCYDEDVVVDSEEEDGNWKKTELAQGIDAKADEFIAKFYHDIKLQRLNSYRQYTEMIKRGSN